MKEELKKLVFEALGETSAVFMSKEEGKNIVMPSEELVKIGNKLVEDIMNFLD